MKTIAILTDFGLKDNFVGVMKAVILKINPKVNLVDITHEISPQNIKEAAFLLLKSYSYFPKGSVFLVVVDPGVGSKRRPIAIKTKNYYFVGPDNGILSLAAINDGVKEIVHLKNKRFFLKEVSSTFHGRDIFAPVSAYLSKGVTLAYLGEKIKEICKLELPSFKREKDKLVAEIIYIDRFGNLITNISKEVFFDFIKNKKFIAYLKNKKIKNFFSSYQDATDNLPFFIEGSFSYLEIALKNKSAFEYFSLKREEKPKVIIKKL
jgi:hypothetical protein